WASASASLRQPPPPTRRAGNQRTDGPDGPTSWHSPLRESYHRMNILFASQIEPADRWLPLLKAALPRDRILLEAQAEVDVALVASPPPGTLEKLKGAK